MKDLYGVYSVKLAHGDTTILMSLVASNPTNAIAKAESEMSGWCATDVSFINPISKQDRQ